MALQQGACLGRWGGITRECLPLGHKHTLNMPLKTMHEMNCKKLPTSQLLEYWWKGFIIKRQSYTATYKPLHLSSFRSKKLQANHGSPSH